MDNHRKQRARHKESTQNICRNTNRKRPAEVSETSYQDDRHIQEKLDLMFLGAFPETAGWYWGKLLFTRPELVLNLLNKQSKAQIHQARDTT